MIRAKRRNQATHETEDNARPGSERKQEASAAKAKKAMISAGLKSEERSGLWRNWEPRQWNRIYSRGSLVQGQTLFQGRLLNREEDNRRDENDVLEELASTEPDHQHQDSGTITACLVRGLVGEGSVPRNCTMTWGRRTLTSKGHQILKKILEHSPFPTHRTSFSS